MRWREVGSEVERKVQREGWIEVGREAWREVGREVGREAWREVERHNKYKYKYSSLLVNAPTLTYL